MHPKLNIAILVLVPLLVAASPPSTPSAKVSFANKRRALQFENGVANIIALNAQADSVRAKIARGFSGYKANTGKAHPNDIRNALPTKRIVKSTKRATGQAALTNDDHELWYGPVSVGTPSEIYTVDFDSGSSDLFLPGANCTSNCQGHRVYDTAASSTAVDQHKTFSIEFGDGSTVQGNIFNDTVSLGGLEATDQAVVAATVYSNEFNIIQFPADGLLGLAFPSIANTDRSPVFTTLVSQGKISSPVFGVTLLDKGGELFLGGTDTSAFTGPLTFTPLTVTDPPAFWQVAVTSVSVGDKPAVIAPPMNAIVDTGTTLIIVDPASATLIHALIPGAKPAPFQVGAGFFTIPCDKIPNNVGFKFGNKIFTLDPKTLNFGPVYEGSNDCVSGIMGSVQQFWILGDVFLRNLYTEFDAGNLRVGFAQLTSS